MALKEKLIDKAQKLIQKGYLDKAVIEYRAAADADPRDISIRLRIGDLYVKLGKKTEAVKEYTEAARANAQRGFYLKAIAVYKQVLKLEENLDTHNKLAELYLKQRLIADAVGEYSYIVHWYESRGKTAEVLELLKKMVDIDPENIGVRLKLADLYQKLSFDKDSLTEYSIIFEKLLSAGKLDKAEKVYLSLYNANPSDERVMSGLAELYRLKGDDTQRLKFLKGLFNHYSGASMTGEARRAAEDIVRINPDDPHASRFLKKDEKRGGPQGAQATSEPEAFSIASSIEVPADGAQQKASEEEPIVSWPEEEIEITIEGFEEAAAESSAEGTPLPDAPEEVFEKAAPESPSPAGTGASVEPPASVQETGEAAADEIEIDIDDLLRGELPRIDASAAAVEPVPSAPPAEVADAQTLMSELPVEEAIEVQEIAPSEPVQVQLEETAEEEVVEEAGIEVQEIAPSEPVQVQVEEPAEEVVEEAGIEVQELAPSEPVQVQLEEPAEEAGIEDAISVISAELHEDLSVEPGTEEPQTDEAPVEVPDGAEEVIEALEAETAEPSAEVGQAPEDVPAETLPGPEPTVEIESEPEIDLEPDSPSREAIEAPLEAFDAAGAAEAAEDQAIPAEGEAIEVVDIKAEPLPEDAVAAASVEASEEEAGAPLPVELQDAEPISVVSEEAVPEAAEVEEEQLKEDLSSAIQELMEKMEEPEEAGTPQEAPVTESAGPREDYVDLSAELGMEEALRDLAGPWGGKESAEAFDEFKDGIGNQLNKEDSETHYNLGIAYMEMELYSEASKEFRIALKDGRLELDCYTRLGLCAMAENNPEEAAAYYSKGLKATERSDDEKKALMYELALAYESSGRDDDALDLFREIFAMDPEFREVASKVSSLAFTRPLVPLDDGFIEVELL